MRTLTDRDVRRCGQCGAWTLIGRHCRACTLRIQVECDNATRARLAQAHARQQQRLIEERRAAWLTGN